MLLVIAHVCGVGMAGALEQVVVRGVPLAAQRAVGSVEPWPPAVERHVRGEEAEGGSDVVSDGASCGACEVGVVGDVVGPTLCLPREEALAAHVA